MVEDARSSRFRILLAAVGATFLIAAAILALSHGLTFRRGLLGVAGIISLSISWKAVGFSESYRFAASTLLNTLILLLILEFSATAIVRLRLLPQPRLESGRFVEAYYASTSWGREFLNDGGEPPADNYVPFVLWKSAPYRSRLTRVDSAGDRETPGADCRTGSYKVFVFGGSTVWGQNVPDWGTLPAYLQTRLSAGRRQPVCVRNFGQGGWVSTQGVIELLRHLQAADYPDLVIFYDSSNDIAAGSEEGVAGNNLEILDVRSRFEGAGFSVHAMRLAVSTGLFSLLERLIPSLSSLKYWPARYHEQQIVDSTLAANVTRVYLANYRSVAALSREFGFTFAFFWGPNLDHGHKPLTDEERHILHARRTLYPRVSALMPLVYPRIEAAARGQDHLYYLGDIFAHEGRWVYLNDAHLNPIGNSVIADRIIRDLAWTNR